MPLLRDYIAEHERAINFGGEAVRAIDRGDLAQARFFNLVIRHSMQGFYGAPRHGGNRNYMSYRMMGLDFPLVVGRNHYEQLS